MRAAVALVLTAGLMWVGRVSVADSPITSTNFWQAYSDVGIVQKAAEEKVMSLEFAEYLSDPGAPVDVKAAIINALSWDIDGKCNAELYRYYLALRYRRTLQDLQPQALTADEVLCLGYLTVMDDYFHPEPALSLLEYADTRNPTSFTVAMIVALAKAQDAMGEDFKEVWRLTDRVLKNKKLKQDMRPEAVQTIVDYMKLYNE